MTDEQYTLITKSFPCLSDIPQGEWSGGHVSVSRVPGGTLAFSEGELCEHVAFVLSGGIRVYKVGENGRELTLYRVTPGESCVLMLSSVLAGVGYPAVAAAEKDSDVLLMPVSTFKNWMDQSPSLRQFVYRSFTLRLASLMTLVEEIVFRKVDQRLADLLLKRTTGDRPELNATHDELAVELGTAREVVSRILKELEKESAIRLARGRIRVTDRGLLKTKIE